MLRLTHSRLNCWKTRPFGRILPILTFPLQALQTRSDSLYRDGLLATSTLKSLLL